MSVDKHQISVRHLLGINSLSKDDIKSILDLAGHYADLDHTPEAFDCSFRKLVAVNVFLEASTRTKMSFEMAAHRLGIKPLNFEGATSSLKKGETLLDTLATIAAMKPDVMIVRQSEKGLLEKAAALSPCPVINAGDGAGEHPTQALLDALTIQRHKGGIEGLTVAICGDIPHSRVASSNFLLLSKLGANVNAFTSIPYSSKNDIDPTVKHMESLSEAVTDCDVVMMLRFQTERYKHGQYAIQDSDTGFFKQGPIKECLLTKEILKIAKPDAIVMHPGPMNRGVEIAGDLADDPDRSVILEQVTNGVAVRMAVMDLLTRPLRGDAK